MLTTDEQAELDRLEAMIAGMNREIAGSPPPPPRKLKPSKDKRKQRRLRAKQARKRNR